MNALMSPLSQIIKEQPPVRKIFCQLLHVIGYTHNLRNQRRFEGVHITDNAGDINVKSRLDASQAACEMLPFVQNVAQRLGSVVTGNWDGVIGMLQAVGVDFHQRDLTYR